MSNPYDGMASGFSSGETLGWTAFGSSLVACSVWFELLAPIPADKSGFLLKQVQKYGEKFGLHKSMSIGGQSFDVGLTNVPIRLKLIITDTGAMLEACGRIHESGETAARYVEALDRQLESIQSDVWQGDDQRAFQERLEKYRNAINTNVNLASVTAALTAVVGSLRFVQLAVSCALAVALAAMSVAYWIAMAIPFGQGAAAAIRAAGTPLAKMIPTIIKIMDQVMTVVGQAHVALMAVATLTAGISDSIRLGNAEGMKDLGGAAVETVGDLVKKISKQKISVLGA